MVSLCILCKNNVLNTSASTCVINYLMVPDLMSHYYPHFVPPLSISNISTYFCFYVSSSTIGLFFSAKLAALVHSLSFSFYIWRRKMNTELVRPIQLKRTNLICRWIRLQGINHVTFSLGGNMKSEKFHVNCTIIYDFVKSCNFLNRGNVKFFT